MSFILDVLNYIYIYINVAYILNVIDLTNKNKNNIYHYTYFWKKKINYDRTKKNCYNIKICLDENKH